MNSLEENELKIADYLEDRLSAAEEESFMQELSANVTLRRQYEEVLMVQTLLSPEIGEPIVLHSDNHGQAPVRRLFTPFRVAAALIGIFVGGSLLFLLLRQKNSGEVSPQRIESLSQKSNGLADSIFREYYTPWTSSDVPLGARPAYNAYTERDFSTAVSLPIGNAGNDSRTSAYILFVQGLSYLALDRKEDAIRVLEQVMSASPVVDPVHDAASWYLALALIKNAKPQKAIDLLKQLSSKSSPYKTNASRLLSKLSAG
jgi:hypothetical protein